VRHMYHQWLKLCSAGSSIVARWQTRWPMSWSQPPNFAAASPWATLSIPREADPASHKLRGRSTPTTSPGSLPMRGPPPAIRSNLLARILPYTISCKSINGSFCYRDRGRVEFIASVQARQDNRFIDTQFFEVAKGHRFEIFTSGCLPSSPHLQYLGMEERSNPVSTSATSSLVSIISRLFNSQ
jgi:hypothetical protein